jgi:hypothetical protein
MPEEAAVVRRIFAMYLCGMIILKIKAALEAEGILSPTGKSIWSKRTIDMILSNKKYCGISVVKGSEKLYEIENHHEPIITLQVAYIIKPLDDPDQAVKRNDILQRKEHRLLTVDHFRFFHALHTLLVLGHYYFRFLRRLLGFVTA